MATALVFDDIIFLIHHAEVESKQWTTFNVTDVLTPPRVQPCSGAISVIFDKFKFKHQLLLALINRHTLTFHVLELGIVWGKEGEYPLGFPVTVYVELQVGQHRAETRERGNVIQVWTAERRERCNVYICLSLKKEKKSSLNCGSFLFLQAFTY